VGMTVLVWLGAIGLVMFPEYPVPAPIRFLTFAVAVGLAVAGAAVPHMPSQTKSNPKG